MVCKMHCLDAAYSSNILLWGGYRRWKRISNFSSYRNKNLSCMNPSVKRSKSDGSLHLCEMLSYYSARFQCSPHIDFTRWHISTFYTFMFVSICENTAVCDRSTSGQSALTLHLLSTDILLWSAEKQRRALPFNGGQYMPLFRIWLFCDVIWYHVGLN